MNKTLQTLFTLIICSKAIGEIEVSTPNFSFLGASKQILSLNQQRMFTGRVGNVIDLDKAKEYVVISHNSSMPEKMFYESKLKVLLQNGNFTEGIPKDFSLFPDPSVLLVKLVNDYAILEFYRGFTIIHYDGHYGFVDMDQELTKRPTEP